MPEELEPVIDIFRKGTSRDGIAPLTAYDSAQSKAKLVPLSKRVPIKERREQQQMSSPQPSAQGHFAH